MEGPTDDADVNRLRAQQQRNYLATLLFSQGMPMISHGDELGRTQRGNNNVYCQDNELSWIHWDDADENLIEFTSKMIGLRHRHPVFRRRQYFDGRPMARDEEASLPDIVWLEPEATAKDESDWGSYYDKSIAFFLNGHRLPLAGRHAADGPDHDFYMLLNAHWEPVEYALPRAPFPETWTLVVATADAAPDILAFTAGDKVTVPGRGTVILQSTDR